LTLFTWSYAFGKIDHNILLVAVPALLAFSGWGRVSAESDEGGSPVPRGWLVGMLGLVIGLGMFSAALPKLATGWLAMDHSAVRYHLLQNYHGTGRSGPLTETLLAMDWLPLWVTLDYGTLVLEVGLLVAVLSPVLFRRALALAVLFHLGVWLTMTITFAVSVLAYGAFVRWDWLYRYRLVRLVAGEDGVAPRWVLFPVVGAGVVWGIVAVAWGNPVRALESLVLGASAIEVGVLVVAAIIGLVYLGHRMAMGAGARRKA
jgi:hypothetical protein